jgi:DNA-binding transcriptional LysR family regulator
LQHIRIENLFSEELLLCLPADHALVDQRVVVAADLQREKFILMQEGLDGRSLSPCPGNGSQVDVYSNFPNLFGIIGRRRLC